MTASGRRRWLAAAAGALLVIAAAAVGFVLKEQSATPSRPPGERPELLLLTSLPIVFPEQFTLEGGKSPALAALDERYDVTPISISDAGSLEGHRLLLMAQPRAQPPEILVELDAWVRGGGRVLLLADPTLEWPSDRPLGDLLRPPPAFADTGLLAHWGVRLDAPDEPGPRSLAVNGLEIRTDSPGHLVATRPNCTVDTNGLIARCQVGRGSATVIADADFIGIDQVEGANQSSNLDVLLGELARLEH